MKNASEKIMGVSKEKQEDRNYQRWWLDDLPYDQKTFGQTGSPH